MVRLIQAAMALAVMMVALSSGFLAAMGQPAIVLFLAMSALAALLVSSPRNMLIFVVMGGLVVTGAAQLYVPGARYVRYLVPVVTGALLAYGMVQGIYRDLPVRTRYSGMSVVLALLAAVCVASAVVNFHGLGALANGLQDYFQMAGLLVALLIVAWPERTFDDLPKLLLLIALIQLPFAVHQWLVLVPPRIGFGNGLVAVDVISGTFGGSRFGGGANALLALYQVAVCAVLLALYRFGQLQRWQLLLLCAVLLSPMLVNSAKVVALYLPLVFLVVYYKDALKQPLRFAIIGAVVALMIWGLLNAFVAGTSSKKVSSPADLVEFMIERQTASISERGADYSGLSRWTALTFWVEEQRSAPLANVLIGYGPGSSRVQNTGLNLHQSLAESRYGGLQIGYTAVSALLWDVGLVGLILVLLVFYRGVRASGALVTHYERSDPYRAALFSGLQATLVIIAVSLFHKDFLVFNLPFQTFVMLVLGYLMLHYRQAFVR